MYDNRNEYRTMSAQPTQMLIFYNTSDQSLVFYFIFKQPMQSLKYKWTNLKHSILAAFVERLMCFVKGAVRNYRPGAQLVLNPATGSYPNTEKMNDFTALYFCDFASASFSKFVFLLYLKRLMITFQIAPTTVRKMTNTRIKRKIFALRKFVFESQNNVIHQVPSQRIKVLTLWFIRFSYRSRLLTIAVYVKYNIMYSIDIPSR